MAGKKAPVEFDEIVQQDAGTCFYISIKFPLFDSNGRVHAVCGISTDITERKRAQAELEAFSRKLVESQERVSQSSSVKIQAEIELERGDIPQEMEIHIFRIIQEGLSNMVKHSEASEGMVELKRTGKEILLRITDTGKGLDMEARKQAGGFGLKGMEERVKILGGEFFVDAEAGKGAALEVRAKAG